MKIYLIGLYVDTDDSANVQSIIRATTSYEDAREYVTSKIEEFISDKDIINPSVVHTEEKYAWHVVYKINGIEKDLELEYRIEPIELVTTSDVPECRKPMLEKRCECLEKHNIELKEELSEYKKNNSAAQCFLSFYDGGKYEDFDHILEMTHKAKNILETTNSKEGNTYVIELFENWKKQEAANKQL